MTRRERLERKADRRLDWAESRESKAKSEWNKGDLSESATGIPFGQPILVGHHSEGRHRRTVDRANRAMDRAVENESMANHHRSKAAGLNIMLDKTIFSDDPGSVEALESRIVGYESERTRNNAINKIIRKKPRAEKTPEKIQALVDLGLSETLAEKMFEPDCMNDIGIPAYVNQNLGGRIKADRDRLKRIRRAT